MLSDLLTQSVPVPLRWFTPCKMELFQTTLRRESNIETKQPTLVGTRTNGNPTIYDEVS